MPSSARGTLPAELAMRAHVGPLATSVDARWLMAYAAGVGESDARYFDTTRAGGPAAHPLFVVCVEWAPLLALRAKLVPDEVAPRGVHASHHVVLHRPVRAGDVLWTTARVTAIESRPSGTLLMVRLDTVDGAGAPVATTHHGSIYRGVSVDGAPRAEPVPAIDGAEPADITWEEAVDVSATAAHVYTECSRIFNPIHTDVAVARAAGLPAPILHGTATLARAVSRVVAREAGGDPAAVGAVAVRFSGIVAPPSILRVRGRGRRGDVAAFDALDDAGVPVLSAGAIRLSNGQPS